MENLVEIKDVNFSYDVRPILKGINMTVPRGKIIAIMGLSGCGKTTVLRMIAGVLKARSGTVKVAGQAIHELDHDGLYAMRRKMGMLYQFGALFTDLSALDNVAFQIREHTDLPDAMVEDLALMKLNAVGLRGARDMMPSELSGGMARRVALARTIALDPVLIMYDEPFTGLDPIAMGVISNLIRRLNDVLGATSIIVTHDVQESFKIVDYVYFMADGGVVAEGTPEQIRKSTDPFVRQFVWGEIDGPVPFQYPGAPYAADLGMEAARA
jgi:phospholipid/cholesterol/gamma-HCH transport system ATP-binding protein